MEAIILTAVATGIITGIVSSLGTVKALRVHIEYLRENADRVEKRVAALEKAAI